MASQETSGDSVDRHNWVSSAGGFRGVEAGDAADPPPVAGLPPQQRLIRPRSVPVPRVTPLVMCGRVGRSREHFRLVCVSSLFLGSVDSN